MKNKNNPKSKKYQRQSQALARWWGRLEFAESFSKSTRKIGWIEFTNRRREYGRKRNQRNVGRSSREWAVRPLQHIYSGTQDVQKGK